MVKRSKVKFINWLRRETNLSLSTIVLYDQVSNRYRKNHFMVNQESVDRFLHDECKKGRNNYSKAAMTHYIKFLDLPLITRNYVVKSRKRINRKIPEETIIKVIEKIDEVEYSIPLFKIIATIQYLTGARMSEVITLQKDNIDYISDEEDYVRLKLTGKGDKERVTYIHRSVFNKMLRRFHETANKYLFLRKTKKDYRREEDFERRLSSIRSRYDLALRKAGELVGVSRFSSHEFRRFVANKIRLREKDIRVVQKMLGHTDISTTQRYFDDDPLEVKAVISKHQSEVLE